MAVLIYIIYFEMVTFSHCSSVQALLRKIYNENIYDLSSRFCVGLMFITPLSSVCVCGAASLFSSKWVFEESVLL